MREYPTPEQFTEHPGEHTRTDDESPVIADIHSTMARGTQPRCPYCLLPLEVVETQTVTLRWTWDAQRKCYRKTQDDGASEGPRCARCGVKSWDFTNNGVMEY